MPSLIVLDGVFDPLDAVTSRIVFQRALGRTGLARRLGMATILVTTEGQSKIPIYEQSWY